MKKYLFLATFLLSSIAFLYPSENIMTKGNRLRLREAILIGKNEEACALIQQGIADVPHADLFHSIGENINHTLIDLNCGPLALALFCNNPLIAWTLLSRGGHSLTEIISIKKTTLGVRTREEIFVYQIADLPGREAVKAFITAHFSMLNTSNEGDGEQTNSARKRKRV